MKKDSKVYLFEEMPIPSAVMKLCVPTVLSSLVMVLYNLADTFFVGMLNDCSHPSSPLSGGCRACEAGGCCRFAILSFDR